MLSDIASHAPLNAVQTVSPGELSAYIQTLEQACVANPQSADLRTSLGMAYAVNYDVPKSLDALETAKSLDPENFWAQFKYAELQYRLRALPLAEEQTLRALELAANAAEYTASRRQLQEIRRLTREGTQRPALTKPLPAPALMTLAIFVVLCSLMLVLK